MSKKIKIQDLSMGFIGGGRITQLLLDALQKEGHFPGKVCVSDSNADVLENLKKKFATLETVLADNKKPSACDLVFLALHPAAIAAVLPDIKSELQSSAVFISLAPKYSIDKLSLLLGGFARIVRMIPNAPSIMNEGYNPVAFSGAMIAEKEDLLHLLKTFGECPEVEEEKLEAYAILSAMGPTYLWFQMQKLREMGVSFGLTEKETDKALYEMIKGAAKTLFKSGLSYVDVINLIPVKPLAEDEPAIVQAYETKLKGLYEKLKA